jgi:hypothetical protein
MELKQVKRPDDEEAPPKPLTVILSGTRTHSRDPSRSTAQDDVFRMSVGDEGEYYFFRRLSR